MVSKKKQCKIYVKKKLKILNNITSNEKQKKRNIESIPCCKEAGNILKDKAAKYNVYFPIKTAPKICQILKSDKDKIDPMETSGIYRIEFNKNNKTEYYVGLAKRKNQKT